MIEIFFTILQWEHGVEEFCRGGKYTPYCNFDSKIANRLLICNVIILQINTGKPTTMKSKLHCCKILVVYSSV